jgi:hypothetical protein
MVYSRSTFGGRSDQGPLPGDLAPVFHQRVVRSGGDTQPGDLPVPSAVQASLAKSECHPGVLPQKISPSSSRPTQIGDRYSFLLSGKRTVPGMACGGQGNLRGKDAVAIRMSHETIIELTFDFGNSAAFLQ